MSETDIYHWRATEPDLYSPFQQSLPTGDLLRQLIMRSPMAHIEELLSKTGRRSVLDVGCGTGLLARKLSCAGYQVTGLDVSRTMIRRARSVAPGVSLAWQDATLMSYEHEFDAAVLCLTLHEITSEARAHAMTNALRAVKNGGVVIAVDFMVPATPSFLGGVVRAQIERYKKSFESVSPDHFSNYRQFMAAGGLHEWLRTMGVVVDFETNFYSSNLGLAVVRS